MAQFLIDQIRIIGIKPHQVAQVGEAGLVHADEIDGSILPGADDPPVHVHVIHPDGKATIQLDGATTNSGVPGAVLVQAKAWVALNAAAIRAEWDRMNNPSTR